ncbi:MAG: hypothetical protein STSR0009_08090 [Methanoregula sp.]
MRAVHQDKAPVGEKQFGRDGVDTDTVGCLDDRLPTVQVQVSHMLTNLSKEYALSGMICFIGQSGFFSHPSIVRP